MISLDVPLSYSFNSRTEISNYISQYFIMSTICFFSKIFTVFPSDTGFFNKWLNILFIPVVPVFTNGLAWIPLLCMHRSTLGHLSRGPRQPLSLFPLILSHLKQHRNSSWNPKHGSAKAWKALCQPTCYLHYTLGVTEE